MTKKEFLKTKASTNTKSLALVSWIILVLCVITMGYSVYNSNYGDMRKIPVFNIVLGDKAEVLDDELTEAIQYDNSLLSHQQRAAENLSKRFSFSNFLLFVEITDNGDLDEFSDIVSTYLTIVTAAAIVSAAITLLAVIFKNNYVLILSLLLSVASCFISGTLPLILTVILHIALFVLFILINMEYKKYRNS